MLKNFKNFAIKKDENFHGGPKLTTNVFGNKK